VPDTYDGVMISADIDVPAKRRSWGSKDLWLGWGGPLAVTAVAGIIRFTNLGRPNDVVFDETYYAKDALALLRFGTEHSFLEGADDTILASDGNWRTLDIFTGDPSYVVHPPGGKWVIAAGEYLFGMTPFGWRFAVALMGTIAVWTACTS